MKRRFLIPLILVCLAAGVLPLAAEETASLQDVRAQAVARSTTLQKALLAVDSVKLTEKIQSYTLLPSIAASAKASIGVPTSSFVDAVGVSAGATVTQTIYQGGRSILLAAIDSLATSIAQQEARAAYFDVLTEADAAYYDVLEAQASVDAAQSDLGNAEAAQELAKAKLDAGMIAPVAYLKTESQTAAKQTALAQAQGRLSVAQRTLASLTGLSLPVVIQDIDSSFYDDLMQRFGALSDAGTETLAARIREAAATNSPSLAQATLATRKAEKTVDLAKAAYLPTVSATWSSAVSLKSGSLSASSSLSLSASLSLDVWNTKATVAAKKLAAQETALTLDESERTFELKVQSAIFDSISSARAVSSARKALEYADSHYRSVLEQYRLSAASASDLSDAELLVSTNRSALISARYAFLSGVSALRTLAGLETDELLAPLVP